MDRLLETLRALRAPDGCPWDREQTHDSLRPHLLEEASEAVDALAEDDRDAVVEELGDVLLQVAFHAVIGEEAGRFDYREVETRLVEKLVRRHPHVFGEGEAGDAAQVLATWNAIKAEERAGQETVGPGVPRGLPALSRAAALDEALGWQPEPETGARRLDEVPERPGELAAALLYLAQRARRAGLDPEIILRDALRARSGEDAP